MSVHMFFITHLLLLEEVIVTSFTYLCVMNLIWC